MFVLGVFTFLLSCTSDRRALVSRPLKTHAAYLAKGRQFVLFIVNVGAVLVPTATNAISDACTTCGKSHIGIEAVPLGKVFWNPLDPSFHHWMQHLERNGVTASVVIED